MAACGEGTSSTVGAAAKDCQHPNRAWLLYLHQDHQRCTNRWLYSRWRWWWGLRVPEERPQICETKPHLQPKLSVKSKPRWAAANYYFNDLLWRSRCSEIHVIYGHSVSCFSSFHVRSHCFMASCACYSCYCSLRQFSFSFMGSHYMFLSLFYILVSLRDVWSQRSEHFTPTKSHAVKKQHESMWRGLSTCKKPAASG